MIKHLAFESLLINVIDNRGKTCPTGDSGLPLIATNCVKNSNLYPVFEKIRYVSRETYDSWFRGHPKPGDIIFVNKGSPGQVCLTPDPVNFCIAQDMVAVRANPDLVYPAYLFAALRSEEVQTSISNMHVGTLIPHFKKGDFDKLQIPIPNRETQVFIGDFYLDLSRKIDLNRRMNETLEAIARALFKDWFVDFGPVRAKAEGRHPPGLAPDIAALFPEALDDEDKPVGWTSHPLSDFFDLIGGGTPRTAEPSYWGGPIPWFSVTDVPHGSDVFVVETEKTITQVGLDNCSARLLPISTAIITARGTVGKLAMVGRPMAMNQSCYGISGRSGWPPYFTYFLLKNAVDRLQSNSHGSVFDTITRSTFDGVQGVRPDQRLGAEFDGIVGPLMARILANVEESRTLGALRGLLLPKLMSGEIRVCDAENVVEAAA